VCRRYFRGDFDWSEVFNITFYLFVRLIDTFVEEGTDLHTCIEMLKVILGAARDIYVILN